MSEPMYEVPGSRLRELSDQARTAVPQDDDILVLRFKDPTGKHSKTTTVEIWSRNGMSKDDFRAMIQSVLDGLDDGTFERIG